VPSKSKCSSEGHGKELKEFKEFRSSGVQEFRSSGVQEFRSSGVQEFRSSGVQGGVEHRTSSQKRLQRLNSHGPRVLSSRLLNSCNSLNS
jgi:hypothetical protein